MPGMFTDFWRIVKPSPSKTMYTASGADAAKLYSNFSWYTKVMKGASSRFAKYSQYKNMDADVFIARALDTVAEEMTSINAKTNMPFEIEYQNESNEEVPESVTMTVRAALRHWCDVQALDVTLFDIARTTIKFGDCFFRKASDFKRWKYIDPLDIIGISIDDDGNPEHYHVRVGEKNKKGAFGDVEMYPAAGLVHFSLTSSMGENGPFGESVLFPCVKAFRHLTLLEDSVIIYRIVRAPERRVFFIDTGNMPPQRVKAYLESIKTEMRQKRIPNETGGVDKVDSVYNPMSMVEDFFFSQSAEGRGSRVETLPGGECLALDTKIKLLDGRDVELQQLIKEHEEGKENWVYSCHPTTGKFAPGKITWAGVTRRDAEVIRFTLDNGETFTVTPDHKIPIRDVGFVEAKDLFVGQSLIPLYLRDDKEPGLEKRGRGYLQLFDNVDGKWKFVHREVSKFVRDTEHDNILKHDPDHTEPLTTVHHLDFDRYNNSPSNLARMGSKDHWKYHASLASWDRVNGFMKRLKEENPEAWRKIEETRREGRARWRASLTEEQKLELGRKQRDAQKKYFDTIDEHKRKKHAEVARTNFLKGTDALQEKLKDEEFRSAFGEAISRGHTRSKVENPEMWTKRGLSTARRNAELWSNEEYRARRCVEMKKTFNTYMENDPEGFKERNKKCSEARKYVYDSFIIDRVKLAIRDSGKQFVEKREILASLNGKPDLLDHFKTLNDRQIKILGDRAAEEFTVGALDAIAKSAGFKLWKEFRDSVTGARETYSNHKITNIEWLEERMDTGTITVDGFEELHDYHTFALSCGVFVKNSLGEIADLNYFQNKFLQGLRIPSSYMRGGSDGGIAISDGKVGVAYIEELRFANYVSRLQSKVNETFDRHFKAYMKSAGLKIDPQLFKIKLVDPQNFTKYKQAEVDEKMIGNYSNVKDDETLSVRYKQMHFLGMSEDDIQENEAMLKQERCIPDDGIAERLTDLRMMYDKAFLDNRPEVKLDDSYEDFTSESKKGGGEPSDEEEATADLKKGDGEKGAGGGEAPEEGEGEEPSGKPGEEKAGGEAPEEEKPESDDDLGKQLEKL